MLDEIRTFVVLAESGSLQRASERLFLTPSAVTRQIQRLEATLKTPLLDRRVKPARITREGQAVLEGGRHMLRIMDDLKANGPKDAEPSGMFRIGLSHALAQPSLVAPIQRLTSRFDQLQPVLSTGLRQQLIDQVRAPLTRTLNAKVPLPNQISPTERTKIDGVTEPRIYKFGLSQTQQGDAVLVLQPLQA